MGKTSIVRAALALALLAAAPARAAEPLVPVAAGFQDETVLEGLQSPTAVRVAPPPDGRIFVARKDGAVMLYDGAEDPDPQLAVDLREETLDYLDRGMLGMALDPQFATRPYLYLLYTRDARIGEEPPVWNDVCPGLADAGCPASARLVRVRIDELGVAGPIEPVIEDEWCQQYLSHSIGTVLFGPDGMLYAGAGDAAHFGRADWGQLPDSGPAPPNPCGDPPLEGGSIRSQDLRTAGDPVGLDGAIVRVDPVTGLGAPGNPFAASADPNARRIIAYGLRNPFRFAFRPGTNELWIGEVGRAIWEEIDRIPDTTDATAENFGWPCFEGPTTAATFAHVPVCVGLPASDVTPPVLAYPHYVASVPGEDGCDLRGGASVAGVAFSPSGFPAAYDGAVFFGDFAAGCVFAVRAGAGGTPDPATLELFARREEGDGGPVDLQSGVDGSLYYTLFDSRDPERGSLHRISYRPDNQVPVARASAVPAEGPLPLQVALSAAGSADPDGDALSYAWDLDGDRAFDDATGVAVTHTYAARGQVRVAVRASDGNGASDTDAVTVSPGDTSPRPVIEAPAAGLRWTAGDVITFRGSAPDDEDGAVGAGRLDWVMSLEHCIESTGGCHVHPLEQREGVAGGTFQAPDHPYPARLSIRLEATDSDGLSAETTVRLDQRPPGEPAAPRPQGAVKGEQAAGSAPASEPLRLRLSGARRQALGRRVSVLARCSRRCTLSARAGLAARGRSTVLRAATRAGRRVVVTLPAAARGRARAALRRHRPARVRIVVTARDGAGAKVRATRTVRLVRRR